MRGERTNLTIALDLVLVGAQIPVSKTFGIASLDLTNVKLNGMLSLLYFIFHAFCNVLINNSLVVCNTFFSTTELCQNRLFLEFHQNVTRF